MLLLISNGNYDNLFFQKKTVEHGCSEIFADFSSLQVEYSVTNNQYPQFCLTNKITVNPKYLSSDFHHQNIYYKRTIIHSYQQDQFRSSAISTTVFSRTYCMRSNYIHFMMWLGVIRTPSSTHLPIKHVQHIWRIQICDNSTSAENKLYFKSFGYSLIFIVCLNPPTLARALKCNFFPTPRPLP